MYLKLFLPLIILALIQMLGMLLYDGFSYFLNDETFFVVFLSYFFFICSIFFICYFSDGNKKKLPQNNENFNFKDFIVFISTIFFIVKPSIMLFTIGNEFGYDYVRANYFSDNSFKELIFGNLTISLLTQIYVVPFLWFYVFLLMGSENKYKKTLFYFVLLSLVSFNLAYAGRFYIYFALIALYLKNIIDGNNFVFFVKKYLLFSITLIFLALLMANLRVREDGVATGNKDFLMLLEYHLLPPYFLGQKIDEGNLILLGYPFRTLIEGIFAPILPLFDILVQNIPQLKYPSNFDNPTLYSKYTDSYYNAFSTFFAYIYADFGYFTPIVSFIFVSYLFFTSFFIKNQILRIKYIGYLCLMFYFSLFQATIFSSGTLLVVFFVPLFCLIKSKLISIQSK